MLHRHWGHWGCNQEYVGWFGIVKTPRQLSCTYILDFITHLSYTARSLYQHNLNTVVGLDTKLTLHTQPTTKAANSGGTREPSSKKQFGHTNFFCGFEVLTKLNSKVFLKCLKKFVVSRHRYPWFPLLEYINNFVVFLTHTNQRLQKPYHKANFWIRHQCKISILRLNWKFCFLYKCSKF